MTHLRCDIIELIHKQTRKIQNCKDQLRKATDWIRGNNFLRLEKDGFKLEYVHLITFTLTPRKDWCEISLNVYKAILNGMGTLHYHKLKGDARGRHI